MPKPKYKNKNVAYADCSYSSEVLRIGYDPEREEFYVAIYELPNKVDLKQKLRYIWKIIKTGKPYGDQVVPVKNEMKDIQELLNEVLNEK